jgi:hypothetical protein
VFDEEEQEWGRDWRETPGITLDDIPCIPGTATLKLEPVETPLRDCILEGWELIDGLLNEPVHTNMEGPPDEDTWEPVENFADPLIIEEFRAAQAIAASNDRSTASASAAATMTRVTDAQEMIVKASWGFTLDPSTLEVTAVESGGPCYAAKIQTGQVLVSHAIMSHAYELHRHDCFAVDSG